MIIPLKRFAEHFQARISKSLVFTALFLCGCGASNPALKIAKESISESAYLKRAGDAVVNILGDTSRAVISSESIRARIEAKTRANPAWLEDPKGAREFAFVSKSFSVTNFQNWFFKDALNAFVHKAPTSVPVVSNAMSRVVTEFIALRDAYLADGFDEEWKTNVLKRADTVYSVLSNAIISLNIEANISGVSEECFRTSYRSPYQSRRVRITPTGPAPDERMIVEHLLRFDWRAGAFHQRVSVDSEERAGDFQLIGPYVIAPLPTILTNRTAPSIKKGQFIYTNLVYTNLAVVIFRRETNSILKAVFSDLAQLKDAEFRLGECSLEAKP